MPTDFSQQVGGRHNFEAVFLNTDKLTNRGKCLNQGNTLSQDFGSKTTLINTPPNNK